jgi:hypothetical protein
MPAICLAPSSGRFRRHDIRTAMLNKVAIVGGGIGGLIVTPAEFAANAR